MSVVVDILADRATPEARLARPALFRARMAWTAERRPVPADRAHLTIVGGVSVGDRVEVEVRPGLRRRGVVVAWERPEDRPGVAPVALGGAVARIRLDRDPDADFAITRAPRWRIHPLAKA